MNMKDITAGIILLVLAFLISPAHAETGNATTDLNSSDNTTVENNSSDAAAGTGDEEQLVDDIEPDEGMIGPDNVLYKLKIAFEDLDIAFTFNESEKVGKQVSQARHRLAELKSALKKKNSQAVDTAIGQYEEETQNAEESISRLAGKDKGLIRAQSMIAKHGYVLEGLIDSHPNNSGLIRAYDNSERLLSKFTNKTSIKLERMTDKRGRKVLKHVEVDDDESKDYERTVIKASVEDNRTHVKVELRFLTNSTEPADIAGDILARIDAIDSNVSGIIRIERDNEGNDDGAEPEVTVTGGATTTNTAVQDNSEAAPTKEKLNADAEVRGNLSRVQFEYSFFLDATADSAITSGVKDKLSALTSDKILGALDVAVKESKKEIKKARTDEKKKSEDNLENRNKKGDRKGPGESDD